MMMLFRPARKKDLEDVYELALGAGFGLTSLCKNESELAKRIELSIQSFAKQKDVPLSENYLFVLEDVKKRKVVGTSAIESALGYHQPCYYYRVSSVSKVCKNLNLHIKHEMLHLTNDMQGFSEIGTLFLHRDYRKKGASGLLLSRARFLFMATFLNRFSDFMVAEMRGVSDKQGISPFWESLGKHFFQMPFVQADELTGLSDKQFIADLLPHNPIYTTLLDKAAQAVIGEPHASTRPAMNILLEEGFRYSGYVDIFDSGPTLKACVKDIKTVKRSDVLTIKGISDNVHDKKYFISNEKLDFRAIEGELMVNEDTCIIAREVADLLGVKQGDSVRAIECKTKRA